MVKIFIFGAFLYSVTITSTRALKQLFHWVSGSNGLVDTGQGILYPNTVFRWVFFFGMLKCNEMQMALDRSKINECLCFL